jgi:hypothetical protein
LDLGAPRGRLHAQGPGHTPGTRSERTYLICSGQNKCQRPGHAGHGHSVRRIGTPSVRLRYAGGSLVGAPWELQQGRWWRRCGWQAEPRRGVERTVIMRPDGWWVDGRGSATAGVASVPAVPGRSVGRGARMSAPDLVSYSGRRQRPRPRRDALPEGLGFAGPEAVWAEEPEPMGLAGGFSMPWAPIPPIWLRSLSGTAFVDEFQQQLVIFAAAGVQEKCRQWAVGGDVRLDLRHIP